MSERCFQCTSALSPSYSKEVPLAEGVCVSVGVTVIGEVNAWTSNVMNLIWLIGTFTFAVVLAVVTEDIVATVLVCCLATY